MTSKRYDSAKELLVYQTRLKELHDRWVAKKHQARIINAIFGKEKRKRIFIRGGRKSGKTEMVLYLANRMCLHPGKICSIIGPSLKQQRKIVWNNRRLQDFAPASWEREIREAESMVRFFNNSFIEVDGSENSEAHRGEEQDLLILDELKDHTHDSYEAMYPNLLARDGVLVVIGSPPRDKNNLYYKLEQQALKDPRWLVVHWSPWENDSLPMTWLEEEKAAYYARGDGYLWESEYEAKYVFGGRDAVFAVFDEKRHILPHDLIMTLIEKDKGQLDYFIVSDPGNRICHANLFIAYDRFNGNVYVLDEIYETEQTETATSLLYPRILEKVQEVCPHSIPFHIYDEAALWFSTEINAQFKEKSFPMTPTNKGVKNKEVSMGLIKDCMLKGKFYMSDRCVGLKDEIMSYYLDEKGRYPKERDHAIDALRYFYDFVDYDITLEITNPVRDESRDDLPNIARPVKQESDYFNEDTLWN